ncbi:MAG: outer membrane lipoprotein chaperone LolA [Magnetococcales bacterium]|nr:outer membrane lipoprotein chaperone LolA [Magnetococcales bacterium]
MAWENAWAENAPPTPTALPAPLEKLQTFIDRLVSVQGGFQQRVVFADGAPGKISKGHFIAQKPGRFRWDYQKPFEQLILSDGETVWYYEPDLLQVTRGRADRLQETPAAFLVSDISLVETFNWKIARDRTWGLPAVRLWPRQEEAPFREISITLDEAGLLLLNLEVEDALGHRSFFTFEDLLYNSPVDESRFAFQVPPGVDIVNGPGWSQKP